MGDENSLAGRTQAHKHTAVSSDGGFLDANSITGFSNTSTGSMLYMDASGQATDLGIGAVNTTLQSNGTLPSWASAGGAVQTLLDSQTFTGSSAVTFDYTPASGLDASDYQYLRLYFTGDNLNNNISACYFRLNTGLVDSDYYQNGTETSAGTTSIVNWNPQSGGDDYLKLTDALANAGSDTWNQEVYVMLPYSGQDRCTVRYSGASPSRYYAGSGEVRGLSGSIDKISYELQGPSSPRDMQFTVYGVAF